MESNENSDRELKKKFNEKTEPKVTVVEASETKTETGAKR